MPIEGKLDMTEREHKSYRAPRKGKSYEKKKVEDKKKRGLPTEPDKINVKGFATGRPGLYVVFLFLYILDPIWCKKP